MSRHNIRLNEKSENEFELIKKYVNDSNDNLREQLNNSSTIEFVIEIFVKIFVNPYEENHKNNFSNLISKYTNKNKSEDLNLLKNILGEIHFLKLLELNNSTLIPSENMKSYLENNSEQQKKANTINNLIKKDAERIYKNKNM